MNAPCQISSATFEWKRKLPPRYSGDSVAASQKAKPSAARARAPGGSAAAVPGLVAVRVTPASSAARRAVRVQIQSQRNVSGIASTGSAASAAAWAARMAPPAASEGRTAAPAVAHATAARRPAATVAATMRREGVAVARSTATDAIRRPAGCAAAGNSSNRPERHPVGAGGVVSSNVAQCVESAAAVSVPATRTRGSATGRSDAALIRTRHGAPPPRSRRSSCAPRAARRNATPPSVPACVKLAA
jgi:hypothetical protein